MVSIQISQPAFVCSKLTTKTLEQGVEYVHFLEPILIISHKMLIIAGVSNETTNEITISRALCQKITTFY